MTFERTIFIGWWIQLPYDLLQKPEQRNVSSYSVPEFKNDFEHFNYQVQVKCYLFSFASPSLPSVVPYKTLSPVDPG